MRYRIAFSKREKSDDPDSGMGPSAELDLKLSDGIVAEKIFVEQLESEAEHGQEVLDEDDAFLGSSTPEVWEYEIVDARAPEFEEALDACSLVIEYDVVDSTSTPAEEAQPLPEPSSVYPPDGSEGARPVAQTDVSAAGSGVRAGDDGPAGMPTGDPSAGGLSPARESLPADEAAEFETPASGTLDDLHVASAGKLGITKKPPKAADPASTGSARNPDRGVQTEHPQDRASTLSPAKRTRRRR